MDTYYYDGFVIKPRGKSNSYKIKKARVTEKGNYILIDYTGDRYDNGYNNEVITEFITNGDWTIISQPITRLVENKKILAYKLTEKKYEKAAAAICGYNDKMDEIYSGKGNFTPNSNDRLKLQEAGVLDLWFEPVYEEELKEGDWIYILATGGNIGSYNGTVKNNIIVGKCYRILQIEPKNSYGDINAELSGNSRIRLHTDGQDYEKHYRKATPEEIELTQVKKIIIGNKNVEVTIKKGYIGADGKRIPVGALKDIIKRFEGDLRSGFPWPDCNFVKDVRFIKIGCSIFSIEEIEKVLSVFAEINDYNV